MYKNLKTSNSELETIKHPNNGLLLIPVLHHDFFLFAINLKKQPIFFTLIKHQLSVLGGLEEGGQAKVWVAKLPRMDSNLQFSYLNLPEFCDYRCAPPNLTCIFKRQPTFSIWNVHLIFLLRNTGNFLETKVKKNCLVIYEAKLVNRVITCKKESLKCTVTTSWQYSRREFPWSNQDSITLRNRTNLYPLETLITGHSRQKLSKLL